MLKASLKQLITIEMQYYYAFFRSPIRISSELFPPTLTKHYTPVAAFRAKEVILRMLNVVSLIILLRGLLRKKKNRMKLQGSQSQRQMHQNVALRFENWAVEILRLPAASAAASCTLDVHIGYAIAQ